MPPLRWEQLWVPGTAAGSAVRPIAGTAGYAVDWITVAMDYGMARPDCLITRDPSYFQMSALRESEWTGRQ